MKKIIPLCDPLLKRSIDLINRSSDSDDHYPLKRQRTYQKDNLDIFIDLMVLEKKDVKYIKENLDDASKLAGRVDRIENMLDIPALKK